MASLVDDLKSTIVKEGEQLIVEEDFAKVLQGVVSNYPALKNSPYQSAINDLILAECERYALTRLSEDDLKMIWT